MLLHALLRKDFSVRHCCLLLGQTSREAILASCLKAMRKIQAGVPQKRGLVLSILPIREDGMYGIFLPEMRKPGRTFSCLNNESNF